jgi:RNA polymerase sigma factor (sigma-70 family)
MRGLETILGLERSWLSSQPEFLGVWDAGRDWVESFLVNCERSYSYLYSGKDMVEACREKLAIALVYHWRNAHSAAILASGCPVASVSGRWVVETAQAGMRPTTLDEVERSPRLMGGDPFRDVVLAVGSITGSAAAYEVFRDEYGGDFKRQAERFETSAALLGEWEDLVTQLVTPRPSGPPPLSLFAGYTSLRHWLRPVVRNFLNDLRRHFRAQRAAEQRYHEGRPQSARVLPGTDDQAVEEGFNAFLTAVHAAFSGLGVRPKELLFREYELGESNQQIALQLGLSAGHASRLRRDAHESLKTALCQVVSEPWFLAGNPEAAELWRELALKAPPDWLGTLIPRHPAS